MHALFTKIKKNIFPDKTIPSIQNQKPILVYQPGKVGSRSIYETLKEMGYNAYHVHNLCNLDGMEQYVRETYPNPEYSLKEIGRGRTIRALIDNSSDNTVWNVITMVRDPIARHVSAVFELLPQVLSDFDTNVLGEQATIEKIQQLAMSLPEGMMSWYEEQLQPVFGIDIYVTPFPHNKGYQIYKNKKTRLLLIRLEDLNTIAASAFQEFLDIPDIQLQRKNTGEDKKYGDMYAEFRKLKFPIEYINQFYNNRFSQHFYDKIKIEGFRKKWSLE